MRYQSSIVIFSGKSTHSIEYLPIFYLYCKRSFLCPLS
uniref:Uncharacterized protein n=1 Tax=Utricularia reniformis TaxID=192314 RepID=A0A1Y0B1F6_9LAMI|nr:hypothetical protein AEK19_MT1003 [Utricularia reniformis]ART31227.1 hypothetical protein AEK19_MT1003 [Utricularia reniformis]